MIPVGVGPNSLVLFHAYNIPTVSVASRVQITSFFVILNLPILLSKKLIANGHVRKNAKLHSRKVITEE